MIKKITMTDKETGKETELKPISVAFSSNDAPPTNIRTSYKFECHMDIRNYYAKVPELYRKSWEWARANELADRLNDIIEEYHAPGTVRKVRRALQRSFDKTIKQLDRHCRMYKIIYKFYNQ